jgi:hypothetical protein
MTEQTEKYYGFFPFVPSSLFFTSVLLHTQNGRIRLQACVNGRLHVSICV